MHHIKTTCVPWAAEYVEPAFAGDVDAAGNLVVALSNAERGAVALFMWRAKVPVDAFREYFSNAWDHDHRYVIEAAQTRRRLGFMFRYASFTLPAELPDMVTVWRGTSHLPFKEAKRGYSWTTDRDTACWFAMRFAATNGSPLVITADIAKRDIALFHNERKESEAVLMRPPAARIDGAVSEWTERYQRKQDAMNRDRAADLANSPALAPNAPGTRTG